MDAEKVTLSPGPSAYFGGPFTKPYPHS
jgi:hypothetical protein